MNVRSTHCRPPVCHDVRTLSYRWNRRNPTPFTAWLRAVTAAIPDGFVPKRRIYKRRRTGDDPSVAECPTTGGSSVRPTGHRVCPDVGITSHNKHWTNTRRESHSESIAVCRTPRGQHNTTQQWESESGKREERRGVPGWPLHSTPLHSTPLPGDCPVTGYTPIPTVCWLGSLQP